MFGHNRGMGLFSPKNAGTPAGGPRQLILVPQQGFSGNGMATIGMDNTFSILAHLPAPHTLSPRAPAVYAAYLVDGKGKNGFYAGTLRPAGNGMFQASFRSPVPLVHYDKVVISLESPQAIMQAPQGPIIMKVKQGMLDGGLAPVKKVGGDMWGKVKGFVGNRFGKKSEEVEEMPMQAPQPYSAWPASPAPASPPQQYSAQQAPPQQYAPQPIPQGTYQPGNVPPGRNAYNPGMNQQRYSQPYAPPGGYMPGYQQPSPPAGNPQAGPAPAQASAQAPVQAPAQASAQSPPEPYN